MICEKAYQGLFFCLNRASMMPPEILMTLRRALLLSFVCLALPVHLLAEEANWESEVLRLLEAGDYQAAEVSLLTLHEQPGMYSIHLYLGEAYLGQGLPLKARAEYEKCLLLAVQEMQKGTPLAGLALVALLEEDIDHARRLVDQAFAVAPHGPFVRFAQGMVALEEKKPAVALKTATDLLSEDAKNLAALMLGAMAAAQANQPDQAQQFLGRLTKLVRPDHPFVLAARCVLAQAQHQTTEALAALEALRQKLPAHARLAVEHARLLVAQHRPDEAVRCFESPLAASPDLPYLLRARAEVFLNAGIPGRAAEDLERLVTRQKALTDDFLLLAEAYRQTRDHEHWLDAQAPASPDGPYLLGACLEDQGDDPGALEAYARALQRDPFFAPTLLARGDLYLRQDRLDEARRDADALLHAHPGDERGKMLLASIELLQDHADVAEKLLREVLAQSPDETEAQLLLGLALERLGRHEEALAVQSALSMQEMSPLEMVRGLLLLHETKQDDKVVTMARAFLRDHPRDYGVRSLLIDALVNLARWDEALAAIDEQAGAWGSSRALDLLRARCLGETGKLPEALALLDQYVQKYPADLRGLYLRGSLRQRSGNLDGALADFTELARLDTQAAAPRLALAKLFIDRHEFDRARAEAWLYQRRTSHPAAGWRLRGQVELAAGNYREAVDCFSQTLKLLPDDVQALEMRAKAYDALGQTALAQADRQRLSQLQAGHP